MDSIERLWAEMAKVQVSVARLEEWKGHTTRWSSSVDQNINGLQRTSIASQQLLHQHDTQIATWESKQTTIREQQIAMDHRRQALALFQWVAVGITIILASAKVLPEWAVEAIKQIFVLGLGK